jgi:hypothetical protein
VSPVRYEIYPLCVLNTVDNVQNCESYINVPSETLHFQALSFGDQLHQCLRQKHFFPKRVRIFFHSIPCCLLNKFQSLLQAFAQLVTRSSSEHAAQLFQFADNFLVSNSQGRLARSHDGGHGTISYGLRVAVTSMAA